VSRSAASSVGGGIDERFRFWYSHAHNQDTERPG
jgi:hypothetical protein